MTPFHNHEDKGIIDQSLLLQHEQYVDPEQFGQRGDIQFRHDVKHTAPAKQAISNRNCYDNAPTESFWSTLKNELVYHRDYQSRKEAIREITEYIEIFYNRQRIQKKLGYLSPAAYERKYYEKMLAA